jgi:hypothetical protein
VFVNSKLVGHFMTTNSSFADMQTATLKKITVQKAENATLDKILLTKKLKTLVTKSPPPLAFKNKFIVFQKEGGTSFGIARDYKEYQAGSLAIIVGSYLDNRECALDSYREGQTIEPRPGPTEWTDSWSMVWGSAGALDEINSGAGVELQFYFENQDNNFYYENDAESFIRTPAEKLFDQSELDKPLSSIPYPNNCLTTLEKTLWKDRLVKVCNMEAN